MPAGRARGTVVGEELLIVSGKGVGVVGVEADSGAGDSRGGRVAPRRDRDLRAFPPRGLAPQARFLLRL